MPQQLKHHDPTAIPDPSRSPGAAAGVRTCYDKCAANWPPLIAPAEAEAEGGFGLIDRTDGTMQWIRQDRPLYLWVGDAKPGDVTGDGVNDVWHAAKPAE